MRASSLKRYQIGSTLSHIKGTERILRSCLSLEREAVARFSKLGIKWTEMYTVLRSSSSVGKTSRRIRR
jgi:hypothetical protein